MSVDAVKVSQRNAEQRNAEQPSQRRYRHTEQILTLDDSMLKNQGSVQGSVQENKFNNLYICVITEPIELY